MAERKIETPCKVCGGELVQDYWFRPFDMHTRIGGPPEKGKRHGYHCVECGIKYKKIPGTAENPWESENV